MWRTPRSDPRGQAREHRGAVRERLGFVATEFMSRDLQVAQERGRAQVAGVLGKPLHIPVRLSPLRIGWTSTTSSKSISKGYASFDTNSWSSSSRRWSSSHLLNGRSVSPVRDRDTGEKAYRKARR